jgi:crossover junction endodeoxyribonuclease RuvC
MILGVDPGASGALAFFEPLEGLTVIDMPTLEVKRGGKAKREISPAMLAAEIRSMEPDAAVIEKVGAMPGQGVSSMFQFGRSVGMVEGVLAALQIPYEYVTPQTWQKAVGARGGKDASRLRAMEIYPAYANEFRLKKHDGRADASLIAWYGVTKNAP